MRGAVAKPWGGSRVGPRGSAVFREFRGLGFGGLGFRVFRVLGLGLGVLGFGVEGLGVLGGLGFGV